MAAHLSQKGYLCIKGQQSPLKTYRNMEYLKVAIAHIVARIGLGDAAVGPLFTAAILVIIAIISALAVKFFRMAVTPALRALVSQTRTEWDDRLLSPGVLHALARLIPPVIWYALLPMAFAENPLLLNVLHKACLIYLTVVVLLFIHALLDTLQNISSEHETLRNRPLKGVYQMVNLIAAAVGIIIIISILIDKDASAILTGLGASAAILMLIFKDTILGLVAGVQLSANDMLRPGDWITMSKYGADGYVTEVTLTTVKIQNFDKTVTTIPPYALVSDSFQNWRAMRESGGRRIKRSLPVDVNTITVMPRGRIEALIGEGLATPEHLQRETSNLRLMIDYAVGHIQRRDDINHDLMQMVRLLQPTAEGLPVEIYCFTATTVWPEYEAVQNDLFDHLISILPRFGLRLYQRPAGRDITGREGPDTTQA